MANFQVAPKLYIANSAADLSFLFFTLGANGYTKTADQDNATELTRRTAQQGADLLKSIPFGDFYADNIKKVSAARAVPSSVNEVNTVFTASALVADRELYLDVEMISSDKVSALAQWDTSKYARTKTYQIMTQAGDTGATIANRIFDQMNYDSYQLGLDQQFYVTEHTNNTATITFRGTDPAITLKITLRDIEGGSGLTIANTVVSEAYIGRGSYDALKTWRLETDVTVRPYAGTGEYDGNSNELPGQNTKYASIMVEQEVHRPDLSGSSVINDGPIKGVYAWHLYINEALGEQIKSFIAFLEANAPVKEFYAATTAGAAIAAETPEATSATFLTGL